MKLCSYSKERLLKSFKYTLAFSNLEFTKPLFHLHLLSDLLRKYSRLSSARGVCLPAGVFSRIGVKYHSRSDLKRKNLATHMYATTQHTDAH